MSLNFLLSHLRFYNEGAIAPPLAHLTLRKSDFLVKTLTEQAFNIFKRATLNELREAIVDICDRSAILAAPGVDLFVKSCYH